MKIILTGASGLIGSKFEELLYENHEIIPVTSRDINLTVVDSINQFFDGKDADVLIHFAGKTDVDKCEEDKEEDQSKINRSLRDESDLEKMDWGADVEWLGSSSAFAVNFIGTLNLYKAAKSKGMKFINISSDFVFEGEGEYSEEDIPKPVNWYGATKYYAERIIDTSEDLNVRLSFPYGHMSSVKKDFVWKLVGLLKEKDEVNLINDQTITPTFIDDIVWGLDFLLSKNAKGIYHLTGSSSENPFDIGGKIKAMLNLDTKIGSTTREELYAGKASRPFKSIMRNAKIVNLGFKPKSFDEGIELILK